MGKSMTIYLQEAKRQFLQTYSSYIDCFDKCDVDVIYKIKRASYVLGWVDIVAEIQLVPKEEYKNGEKYWKICSTKLLTLRGRKKNYKCVIKHKKDFLLTLFLKKHLKLLESNSPCNVCKGNVGNLIFQIIFFTRFSKFPQKYRGKELSMVYLVLGLIYIAIMMVLIKTWYPWY